MQPVKEVHLVMSVRKIFNSIIFCVLASSYCDGQNRTWGISISPGLSKTKVVGSIGYYGSVAFVDLKIFEPWRFSIHSEAFIRSTRKFLVVTKAVGFSTYRYYDRWEYDPSTTATNYVWGERSFLFMHAAYKIGHEISLGKSMFLVPETGLSVDYMIMGKYESESKVGMVNQNLLSSLDRTNFGFTASLKLKAKLNDRLDFMVGPCYKILIKEYKLPSERRLYFVGLSLDVLLPFRGGL